MNLASIKLTFPPMDFDIGEIVDGGEWECKEIVETMDSFAIQDDPKLRGVTEVPRLVYTNLYCLSESGWRWFLPRGLKFYLEASEEEGSFELELFLYCLARGDIVRKLSWLTEPQVLFLVEFLDMLEGSLGSGYEAEISEANVNLSTILHNNARQ